MTPSGHQDGNAMSGFLDPGFDYSTDELSVDEVNRYLAWCSRVHGEGNLELVPFAEFFVECDPAGLKYLRRQTSKISLPVGAAVLMWVHTYCVMGSPKGTLYEVIAARELGITRDQIIEVIRCAGYVAGPYALNAAGELTLPYLRAWPVDEKPALAPSFPSSWKADAKAFATGIDHGIDELQEGELGLITGWYDEVFGQTPEGLRLAAEANPSAFKLARVRFERIPESSLPAQVFPLLMMHTALVQGRAAAARRAIQLADHQGVERDILTDVVHWASVLGGESALERGMEILQSCFRSVETTPTQA